MIKVVKIGPLTSFFILLCILALFLSFPFLIATFLILMGARRLLMSWKNSQKQIDPNISKTLKNDKIGEYKIKQNPNDPSIVEVL